MRKSLVVLLSLLLALPAHPAACIFNGTLVKCFKSNLSLNDNVKILSGTDDPTSVAQSAPRGSLYLRTGASGGDVYRKHTDDGSSTNWTKLETTAPDQSYELNNLGIAASVAANALTVALKTKAGADAGAATPVKIGMRNSTAATGTYNQRSVTGALSVVVSSGSTLGHTSGNNHYIYVYAIDNSGTVELAVSSTRFDDGSIQTTSAEGGAGAADSFSGFYSTTARSNVPVRLIGRLKSSQATAGTWATAISEISLSPYSEQSVRTATVGQDQMCRIRFDGTGTPSITNQSGNCVTSITDNGTGSWTLNFIAGMFSAAPNCVCTGDSSISVCTASAETTTAVTISNKRFDTNAFTDDANLKVICIGAK